MNRRNQQQKVNSKKCFRFLIALCLHHILFTIHRRKSVEVNAFSTVSITARTTSSSSSTTSLRNIVSSRHQQQQQQQQQQQRKFNKKVNYDENLSKNNHEDTISINNNDSSLSSIRIRTTKESELPAIVDLLAFESAYSSSSSRQQQLQQKSILFGNWNISIQKIKNEASLTSQLQHRLAAVKHASKVLSSSSSSSSSLFDYDNHEYDTNEVMRHTLWSDDTFRNKLRKAAKVTSDCEGTIWDDWNFSITPDPIMLQHCMMTAYDLDFVGGGFVASSNIDGGSGDDDSNDDDFGVVGFCEVGICQMPSSFVNKYFNYEIYEADDVIMIPCIGNVVVSPNHRRRGIGKKLIQSAKRMVGIKLPHDKNKYSSNNNNNNNINDSFDEDDEDEKKKNALLQGIIGLYVNHDNLSAIRLYEKQGFVVVGKDEDTKKLIMLMNVAAPPSQTLDARYEMDKEKDYEMAEERELSLNYLQ